ncbi:hypothetical protein FQN49_000696 [Arthroderma sp. PD_2]|nr:hypothetical protein FQN49_000696 [Arthroderma sp. PD_2]
MKASAFALLAFIASLLAVVEAAYSWASFHGLTRKEFESKLDGYIKLDGWHITYISAHSNALGNSTFCAVFDAPETTYPGWYTYYDNTLEEYRKEVNDRRRRGFRLSQVDGDSAYGKRYFNSIWERNTKNIQWVEKINQPSHVFDKSYKEYVSKGYRLRTLSGYGFNGEQQFASVWEKKPGPPQKAYTRLTAAKFKTTFDQARKDGYYPLHISPYNLGKEVYFAGIFEKLDGKADKPECQWGLTSDEYVKVFNNWRNKGYKPTVVEGYLDGGHKYAAIFNKIPSGKAQTRV